MNATKQLTLNNKKSDLTRALLRRLVANNNSIWSSKMASDSGLSKISKGALLSFSATCLIIIIAFSTNSWLETDGTLESPKFIQLGELSVVWSMLGDIDRPRLSLS